jgi:fibronectin type 3 domain-containing protein
MRHAVRSRIFSTGHIFITGILLISGLFLSCERQIPGPISPPRQVSVPPTPANIQATVGDRIVFLSWDISDTANILLYRVYLSDSTETNYELFDEVQGTSAEVTNLQNSTLYYFRVAAVSRTRFEGYPSISVSAVPDLYAIIINSGDSYTNSRDISLTLVAPIDTRHMQISDNPAFDGAAWESFAVSRPWEMPPGDGSFTIYARYRDRTDNVTSNYYSDNITLDTEAIIDSVKFSPVGAPLSPGDLIHFKLFTDEIDGQAAIVIGSGQAEIVLYDDGSRGDIIADDGIYAGDLIVGNNLDFENAAVVGNLLDRAGNRAAQLRCRDNVTVRRAPDPVSIYSITNESGRYDRLILNWNSSTAADFAQYRIFRAIVAGVDSSDFLVRSLTSPSATSLTDTGLVQNTTYYYRVYVIDNTGLWAGSNEAHASTTPNTPPDGVVIFPIVAVPGTHDQLDITWSACTDQDFLRYTLYRSENNQVDTLDALVFASDSEERFTDNDLSSNTSYYYRIRSLDRAGNFAWSNTANGRTGIDEPPEPALIVPLFPEPDHYEEINLSWSQLQIDDFRDYRIYTWREDLGRDDSLLIGVIANQATTTFIHSPTIPTGIDTANYWYIIYTYDIGGNSAASNFVRAHLSDIVPGQVSGAVIPDSNFLSVSWVPTEIPDFSSYRVLRDTLSIPNQAVVVYLSPTQETNSYSDRNTTQGETYYYWLDIFDQRNHSSRTFLGSSQW